MVMTPQNTSIETVQKSLVNFVSWLDAYGETSFDHQSFFVSDIGRKAKGLYYRNALLGTLAERIGGRFGASSVFGTPVERGGVTVVPVASASRAGVIAVVHLRSWPVDP